MQCCCPALPDPDFTSLEICAWHLSGTFLNAAAWELGYLVDEGTVDKKAAYEMLARLVEGAMVHGRAPERPRKAAASARPGRRKTP